MANVTMTFTHCDTLQREPISDTLFATVHFELVVDGANYGPFSSTIELGEGTTPEVTTPAPTGSGPHERPPITIPLDLLREVAVRYLGRSMETAKTAVERVRETHPDSDDEPLLRSTKVQMTASFDIEDSSPQPPKRRRSWPPWRA